MKFLRFRMEHNGDALPMLPMDQMGLVTEDRIGRAAEPDRAGHVKRLYVCRGRPEAPREWPNTGGSAMGQKKVKMYTLSTCSHCIAAKQWMTDHGIEFEYTDVDLLAGEERKDMIREIREYNPEYDVPHDRDRRGGHHRERGRAAQEGPRPQRLRGTGMTAEEAYEMLKKVQGAQGVLLQ